MLSSLIHGDWTKLGFCSDLSARLSVPVCVGFVCQCASKAIFNAQCNCPGKSIAFLPLLSLSLVSFLLVFFFYFHLNCLPCVLFYRCTTRYPGEQWFSNNLCSKPVDLMIGQSKLENNSKGQFSIFPLVRLRFVDTPGLVIGTFIMQAMLHMT